MPLYRRDTAAAAITDRPPDSGTDRENYRRGASAIPMATPRIAGTTQPSWYCCKGSIASAASSQPMEPPKTATKLEMQVAKDAMPTSRVQQPCC